MNVASLVTKAHNITKNIFNAEARGLAEIAQLKQQIKEKKLAKEVTKREAIHKAKVESDKALALKLSTIHARIEKQHKEDAVIKQAIAQRAKLDRIAKKLAEQAKQEVVIATNKLKATGYVVINTLQNAYNELVRSSDIDEETITSYEEHRQTAVDTLNELMGDVTRIATGEYSHLAENAQTIFNDYIQKVDNLDIVQYALRNNKTTRYFSDEQRTEIFLRDNGTCQLCQTKVSLKNYDCDHIVPYSKGGETTVDNGQCTCSTCNRAKGNKL